jgi:hypothetical protein
MSEAIAFCSAWRLYVQHITRPNSPLDATNRTFRARTYNEAMRKATKFVRDAQLSCMIYDVRKEALGDE